MEYKNRQIRKREEREEKKDGEKFLSSVVQALAPYGLNVTSAGVAPTMIGIGGDADFLSGTAYFGKANVRYGAISFNQACVRCNKHDFRLGRNCMICGHGFPRDLLGYHCIDCHTSVFCYLCGEICPGTCALNKPSFSEEEWSFVPSQHFSDLAEMYELYPDMTRKDVLHFTTWDVMMDRVSDQSDWQLMPPCWKMRAYMILIKQQGLAISTEYLDRLRIQHNRWPVIRPQSLEAVHATLGNFAGVVKQVVEGAKTSVVQGVENTMTLFSELINTMCRAVAQAIFDPVKALTLDFIESCISDFTGEARKFWEENRFFMLGLLKIILRYILGYPAAMLAFEMILDRDVLSRLLCLPELLNEFFSIKPQGLEDPIVYVFATLFYFLSKKTSLKKRDFLEVGGLVTAANLIVPSGVSDFISKIPFLSALMRCDPFDMMMERYPCTFNYMNFVARHAADANPPPWIVQQGKNMYLAYVEEMKRMDPKTLRYIRLRPELFRQPGFISDPQPNERKQPRVIYLEGTPGAGKTHSCMVMVKILYKWCKENKVIDPEMLQKDFYCNVTGITKHMDTYKGQPVLIFNDFLSQKEAVGESVASLFLGAVDTAPFSAPMAEIVKKGMFIEPLFVIVTSNISWNVFKNYLDASNNPSAYVRRITHYFKVVPKKMDNLGVVDFSEQGFRHSFFHKYLKPNTQNYVQMEFDEVVRLMLQDIKEWWESPMPHDQIADELADLTAEYALAQGIGMPTLDTFYSIFGTVESKVTFDMIYTVDQSYFAQGAIVGNCDLLADLKTLIQMAQKKIPRGIYEDLFDWNSFDIDYEEHSHYVFYPNPKACMILAGTPSKHLSMLKVGGTVIAVAALMVLLKKTLVKPVKEDWEKGTDGVYIKKTEFESGTIEFGGVLYEKRPFQTKEGTVVALWPQAADPQGIPLEVVRRRQQHLANPSDFISEEIFMTANRRLEQQLPGLQKSIVRVSSDFGVFVSMGFALSTSEILLAGHVAKALGSTMVIQFGSGYNKAVKLTNLPGRTDFSVYHDTKADLALIYIHSTRICNCVDHTTKFVNICPEKGAVIRLHPDKVSESVWFDGKSDITYDRGGVITAVKVSLPNEAGICGLPYYMSGDTAPERLVGIHVAGNTIFGNSYFAPVDQTWIMKARGSMPVLKPLSVVDGVEPQGKLADILDDCGFQMGPKVSTVVNLPRRSALAPVKGLYEDRDSVWRREYGLARLTSFVNDVGETDNPEYIRLRKWSKKMGQHREVDLSAPAVVVHMLEQELPTGCVDVEKLPSFQEVVKNCPEDLWTGMDRSKSGGPILKGMPKYLVCDLDAEEPTLTAWTIDVLQEMEHMLEEGRSIPFRRGISMKDEKLPLQKVIEGKTRLFAPDDVFLYILSKKYFYFALTLFAREGKNFGIPFNMSPLDLGKYMEKYQNRKVIGADVESMDQSHSFDKWILFMKICLSKNWVSNFGVTRKVHPDLPPLNGVNIIRLSLLREMALGAFQMLDQVFYIPGALGSGGLLTTLFNSFMGRVVKAAVDVQLTVPERKMVDLVNFGDDQFWVVDSRFVNSNKLCEVISTEALKLGYTLTSEDKKPELQLKKFTEVSFCGRRFRQHDYLGPVMALELPRIVKMVQFSKKSAFVSNFPGQVATYLREAGLHDENTYRYLRAQLRWDNGYSLVDYVCPTYEDVANWHLGEHALISDSDVRSGVFDWISDMNKQVEVVEQQMFKSPVDSVVKQSEKAIEKAQPEKEQNEIAQATGPTDEDGMFDMIEQGERDVAKLPTTSYDYLNSFLADHVEPVWTRPHLLHKVDWVKLNNAMDHLHNDTYPSAYFNGAANAQMKLANTVGMRCTVVVRVVINSMAYQSGMLALWASPMARVPTSIEQIFSGPHAILAAGSHTSAEIEIGFDREWLYSLSALYSTSNSSHFDFVRVGLTVIEPLDTGVGGVDTVGVVVMSALKDTVVMQGGLTGFLIAAQGKKSNKENPNVMVTEASKDTVGTSVVSRFLKTVGGAAVAATETLTVLGKMAVTAVEVAALFGLSKPNIDNNLTLVVPRQAAFMPNANGVDAAVNMAIDKDGKSIAPPTLSEGDPMDVVSLCSRVGLLTRLAYTPATVTDSILGFWAASPGVRDGVKPIPVNLCCSLFRYWRGTMCYRLRAVKTAYHTGTLEVAVTYGTNISPSNDSRSNVLHRVLWDLALMDSIVIRVPYVSQFHWQPFTPTALGVTSDTNVYIKAHTSLNAPPNVSQEVPIFVEVWSPDMEVAWPFMSFDNQPFLLPPVSEKKLGKQSVVPQGMDGQYDKGNQGPFDPGVEHQLEPDVLLGPYPTRQNPVLAERYLAGEIHVNLRRCLRRFLRVSTITHTPVLGSEYTDVGGVPDITVLHAFHRAIAAFYVFGFGGYRMKIVPANTASVITCTYSGMVSLNKANDLIQPEPIQVFCATGVPVAEVALPNVSNKPYYVLQNNFMNPLSLRIKTAAGDYDLFTAGNDDLSFYGINYLPDYATAGQTTLSDSPAQVP